jgi:eukaryotic-like serine/threonine-protein kinase
MSNSNQREEMLFHAARMLTEARSRQAFLDQVCLEDPDLRGRLEALLASQADAENFFSDAASTKLFSFSEGEAASRTRTPHTNGTNGTNGTRGHGAGVERSPAEAPGTRIGRYKLLQRIGEGGGGVVYMGEQEEPVRRRIALKIIKLGMDTKSVIARFEVERQALAMMDHPNIARVLDAGATETGRPFFVMELVRGVKITEYCDQNHLDTRRRLNLFTQICQAIQHAHQKGIIHRDIKPSNILVTLHDGVPVPKIIDFGIAKATEMRLTDKTLFTAYEQFMGTPAYMSPEQAEMSGLDVDTRSDIYSLGVLLYELLTGRTPFDPKKLIQSGLDELRRTLREREPQRPSTMLTTLQGDELKTTAIRREAEPPKLISLLKGDLDWIVMKSLEKDRTRRYETANGLAMDIQRYLNNEPILARPPSRRYRFHKLVRRNKVVFAAAGAVTAALIFGLGTSTWLFLKEREARMEAEHARQNEATLRRQSDAHAKMTEAAFEARQEHYERADTLIQGISSPQPSLETAEVFRSLGDWHATHGRWKIAADRFTALLKINQHDVWNVASADYLECGPALIESGDLPAYERFRRSAIMRFADTTNAVVAERIVKISLLVPGDETLMASLNPLADFAAKSFAKETDTESAIFLAAWKSISLALMEYRRGNYAGAAEWGQRCLDYRERNAPRTATAQVIRAMALHQLHRDPEARAELVQGRDEIEGTFTRELERGSGGEGFWFDWVFARILLREATAMMDPA